MRKNLIIVLSLIVISACISCGAYDMAYGFYFYNDTNEDVYIIISEAANEDIIPISQCRRVCANKRFNVLSRKPWEDLIRDSAFIYVINYKSIELPTDRLLNTTDINDITSDMILSRITLYSYQLYGTYSVHYPYSPEDYYVKPGELEP